MEEKEKYKVGDTCKLCKKGRIALGSVLVQYMELDQEPYENGKIEKDGEEIQLNDNINISVHACDFCGEIYDINIQNVNYLKYKEN